MSYILLTLYVCEMKTSSIIEAALLLYKHVEHWTSLTNVYNLTATAPPTALPILIIKTAVTSLIK